MFVTNRGIGFLGIVHGGNGRQHVMAQNGERGADEHSEENNHTADGERRLEEVDRQEFVQSLCCYWNWKRIP